MLECGFKVGASTCITRADARYGGSTSIKRYWRAYCMRGSCKDPEVSVPGSASGEVEAKSFVLLRVGDGKTPGCGDKAWGRYIYSRRRLFGVSASTCPIDARTPMQALRPEMAGATAPVKRVAQRLRRASLAKMALRSARGPLMSRKSRAPRSDCDFLVTAML